MFGRARVVTRLLWAERLPNAQKLIEFTHQIVTLATISGDKQLQMRNDILAAISEVPGVIEALSVGFLPN